MVEDKQFKCEKCYHFSSWGKDDGYCRKFCRKLLKKNDFWKFSYYFRKINLKDPDYDDNGDLIEGSDRIVEEVVFINANGIEMIHSDWFVTCKEQLPSIRWFLQNQKMEIFHDLGDVMQVKLHNYLSLANKWPNLYKVELSDKQALKIEESLIL